MKVHFASNYMPFAISLGAALALSKSAKYLREIRPQNLVLPALMGTCLVPLSARMTHEESPEHFRRISRISFSILIGTLLSGRLIGKTTLSLSSSFRFASTLMLPHLLFQTLFSAHYNRLKNNYLSYFHRNQPGSWENLAQSLLSESCDLSHDEEFILELLKMNPSLMPFVSKPLSEESSFILKVIAVCENPNLCFKEGLPAHIANDRAFILKAIQLNPKAFKLASPQLQLDASFVSHAASLKPAIVSTILNNDPDRYETLSDDLKSIKEIALEALKLKNDLYLRLPKQFQEDLDFVCIYGTSNR